MLHSFEDTQPFSIPYLSLLFSHVLNVRITKWRKI